MWFPKLCARAPLGGHLTLFYIFKNSRSQDRIGIVSGTAESESSGCEVMKCSTSMLAVEGPS